MMKELPLTLRRYLIIVWIVGLLAWAASGWLGFEQRILSWPLWFLLMGLLVLTQSLPQHVLPGVKVSPNTIPLFIAVLCLPVSAAVSAAVLATALAHGLRRRPWCEVGFNAASAGLEAFIGGMVYAGLIHIGGSWAALAAASAAAAALYLANSALVAGAVAAQHGLPVGRIWREVAGAEPLDHVLMFLAGGLLALPWTWAPMLAGLLLTGLAVRFALSLGQGWLLRRQRIRA